MNWADVAITAIEVIGSCFVLWLIVRNDHDGK